LAFYFHILKIFRFARVIFESETNRALVTREDKPTVLCASRPQEPFDVPTGVYELSHLYRADLHQRQCSAFHLSVKQV